MATRLKTKVDDYTIDLKLRSKYTIICGNSSSGKTFLYDMLKESNLKNIYFINYDSVCTEENYKSVVDYIKSNKNKLIVIDQVDDIQRLKGNLMYTINLDMYNIYILIARNAQVTYQISDVADISIKNKIISLIYRFEEPIY